MDPKYTFQANARPIQDRARYREIPLEPTQQTCNIIVDPRIKHGSTYNRRNILTEQVTRITSYPRRKVNRSGDEEFETLKEGYSEALVQTDDFDGNVIIIKHEESVGVQTDPYTEKPIIHRKPAPLRAVGVKTNVPGTELFDFEVQVKPFVTTLVQKALTQAAMEYQEEEELKYMQIYLNAFKHTAQKEAEAIKRLEEAELKKYQEKEAIVAKRLAVENGQLEMRAKVLARGFAEWFVWDIHNDVIDHLQKKGYFYDEVQADIEKNYLPWLSEQVDAELVKPSIPQALFDKANQTAVEIADRAANQIEIDTQIINDQKEVKQISLLRSMIGEDRVASKIREAKKMNLLKKNDQDQENQEEEEEVSSTDNQSETNT
ncbi:hypothetical protein M9Y10_022809 [Tritrichomonas musculus]|uniref:Uncharacterized protein n=1 Tax=Tritrichomonas musculus TaxID=1915356 RepID=A0ABR2KTE7_9EUKA